MVISRIGNVPSGRSTFLMKNKEQNGVVGSNPTMATIQTKTTVVVLN